MEPNISTNLLPTIFKYMKQCAKKCAKNMKQTCLLEVWALRNVNEIKP